MLRENSENVSVLYRAKSNICQQGLSKENQVVLNIFNFQMLKIEDEVANASIDENRGRGSKCKHC